MNATSPRVSFVIGSYNRGKFLAATIDSVRKDAANVLHEIIVVDGGSTDGTLDYLLNQYDVITIVQHNRGALAGAQRRRSWGYFINLGFKCAQGTYVCMLSDDCLLIPGSVGAAIESADHAQSAGLRIGGVAFYFRDWPHEAAYKVHRTYGRRLAINHGFFLNEALQAVNYADEVNYSFYCADGDLCLRIWEAGYHIIACERALVEHHAHAPARGTHSRKTEYEKDVAFSRSRWQTLIRESGFESDWPQIRFTDPHDTASAFPHANPLARAKWRVARRAKDFLRRILRPANGRRTGAPSTHD